MSGGWAGRRVYSRAFHRNKNLVRRRSGGRCEVLGDQPWLPRWQQAGPRCGRPARSCDHVLPQSAGGGDQLDNLQDICEQHHTVKTQREAKEARARHSRKRPRMPPPGLRKEPAMEVQFTQAISGRELNEIVDLPDDEAQFLLRGGYVREPGGKTHSDELADPDTAIARTAEVHTEKGVGDRLPVNAEQRADHSSGMGAEPLPEDSDPFVHTDHERNPFAEGADEEQQGDGIDGLKLAELRSYIERLNKDDDQAQLATSGTKEELRARIREYESGQQA